MHAPRIHDRKNLLIIKNLQDVCPVKAIFVFQSGVDRSHKFEIFRGVDGPAMAAMIDRIFNGREPKEIWVLVEIGGDVLALIRLLRLPPGTRQSVYRYDFRVQATGVAAR